jgi:C4-dicarboxylate-specific signal transduction histidine kinase
VFGIDTFTTLAGAVAVLYCPILLVASVDLKVKVIAWSAVGCLGLASLSFYLNHGLSLDADPDFRFLFCIAAILTTAVLLLGHARSFRMQTVRAQIMTDQIARMRSELDQAMRRATIAEVSATIAHELNQPLAAIRSNASATRRWLDRTPSNIPEAVDALDGVINAADHAGLVVRRVRQLFEKGADDRAPVHVDDMVREALGLIEREIAESGATLSVILRAGDSTVFGSRLLLEQSIISLSLGAIEAMQVVPVSERTLSVESELRDGSVAVTIRDAGPGFPHDIDERASDAFFHGKQGGMGLGLTICRSVARTIGGDLRLSNATDDGGAICRLVLPRHVEASCKRP